MELYCKVYTHALEDLNQENSLVKNNRTILIEKKSSNPRLLHVPQTSRSTSSFLSTQWDTGPENEEANVLCRLCGKEEETVDHIINICVMATRTEITYDVYSLEREHIEIVVARIMMFLKLAEERKVMDEDKDE